MGSVSEEVSLAGSSLLPLLINFFNQQWFAIRMHGRTPIRRRRRTPQIIQPPIPPSMRELVAKGPKYREPNRVNWKATETMFLESIDLYAKNWSKREQVELKYFSEWKDQLKELVADRISNLKGHFKSPKCKVLDQLDVKDTLHKLHTNYVLVPADKAANNVIIVCKKYYIDTLVKELGINNVNINNPTYIPIDDSFETIMKSHNQFITSVGLEIYEEDQNLP